MNQLVRTDDALECAIDCVAEVLGAEPHRITPTTPLSVLGLESFTAVRLRRRIRERTGHDLPLTAFLGTATARSVADRLSGAADSASGPDGAGVTRDLDAPDAVDTLDASDPEALDASGSDAPDARDVLDASDIRAAGSFPLTPVQASYLVGRERGLPLGGVATFYFHEYDRTPPKATRSPTRPGWRPPGTASSPTTRCSA
ncbi:phosphopantetheine-binding protein [Streptomyces sp. M19]